ncbi:Fur family transcriptional regulator, peroxide stress response regulator [Fictibacillus solisalsi]|uniref:Fur family transcriptional regulator, peroxide stress response regulator n=1 Tax=Fictibacillus solisalsi TaxID=459525 RepID=A0A1G9XBR8_9BACL|nr:Fur family transcriptional regulator [Fictibacillus solisalsi]SDM93745.1 Fur family transcriptional regulator, peroxide stress response regulator [Fictibacillus solisalsi]
MRITPQRVLILKTIISMNRHLTAEEIHRELPSFITLATVYNNLKYFAELKLINELSFGSSCSKYELANSRHYHVICESCQRIADFNYPLLNEVEYAAAQVAHFKVNRHTLEFYGLCQECSRKNNE